MSFPEVIFDVIKENNCPFYVPGDRFKLSGKALLLEQNNEKTFISTTVIKMPANKTSCRILIKDISQILIKYKSIDRVPGYTVDCSGCTGKIRMRYSSDSKSSAAQTPEKKYDVPPENNILGLLCKFSFFQDLEESTVREMLPHMRMKKYKANEYIIKKGTLENNLYIIVSGLVEVIGKDGFSIAFMGRGEVFGEISMINGDPATASIRVLETAKVLFITRRYFQRFLKKSPALQMYFNRLLARRLAEINAIRSDELKGGFMGELSEMPPPELFQTFHLNEKTGVLRMTLPGGEAKLVFREGKLVNAVYMEENGKEAFFKVLKEKKGRFHFMQGLPTEEKASRFIGDITWLLMDGLRRIDEEKGEGN